MIGLLQCVKTKLCLHRFQRRLLSGTYNHFQTLGMDQSFAISQTDLKSKYKTLMMKLHPDRHVNDADKVEKAAEATHVTRAYDVLNNPLSRALHLLELKGAAIDESDASLIPPSILMEIMEIRETIENSKTDAELRPILEECRHKQNSLCEQLTASFDDDIHKTRHLTACLQYWNRIEETILEKITEV